MADDPKTPPAAAPAPPAASKLKQAKVLRRETSHDYEPGDLGEFEPALFKSLKEDGGIDDHPDAIRTARKPAPKVEEE